MRGSEAFKSAVPVFVSFIEIPGNMDMAIKDSILFADSFIDLVALNINDIYNIREVGRVDSIFPYTLPPLTEQNQLPYGTIDAAKGIVVGWEAKIVEQDVQSQQVSYPFFDKVYTLAANGSANTKVNYSGNGSSSMSVGIGGSMAAFGSRDGDHHRDSSCERMCVSRCASTVRDRGRNTK